MVRRVLTAIAVVLVLAAVVAWVSISRRAERIQRVVKPHAPYELRDDALALHRSLRIVDLHADTMLWGRDALERSELGHVDLPRMRAGNVALQIFSSVTKSPKGQNIHRNSADSDQLTLLVVWQRWPRAAWSSLFSRAVHQVTRFDDTVARSDGALIQIRTKADLKRLFDERATGKDTVGGLMGTEGLHALEGENDNLQRLYDMGVRTAGLHHFFDNELGGSLHGMSKGGLTAFGEQVVAKMNELSMIIDVAHSSEAAIADVLTLSKRPVIVSHTGIKGACDTARNPADNVMKRIAAGGGLVGVGFWNKAVCDITPAGVVKAFRYAIDLLGEDHVALGSDFDGAVTTTFDASELAILTQTMLDQKFTETEIRKVMGENAIRFLAEQLPE